MLESPAWWGGTTSACAENTSKRAKHAFSARNYLRVRGEYEWDSVPVIPSLELPPRARRIQVIYEDSSAVDGTTSACAENTACHGGVTAATRNYLRVRGEYAFGKVLVNRSRELPPRARRIPEDAAEEGEEEGTTSACAENTLSMW